MILSRIDHRTGLPCVQETRRARSVDARRGCTCPQLMCRWKELPATPWQKILHKLQADGSGWTPQYQTWMDGAPDSVLCWKCGRAIKGWMPKLTPFGDHVEVGGQPAVHLGFYDFYRAKRVEVYLPTLDETYELDALHCADCQIEEADGENLVAIWLAGLLEGYREGIRLAARLNLKPSHTPDEVATYLSRWSRAEPGRILHRDPDSKDDPSWRS